MPEPVVKIIEVPCGVDHAFDVFVNRTSKWWPLGGHAVSAAAGKAALAVIIEPRVGGTVYETMHDGARTDWGKVVESEAGRKLAMTWHPGTNTDYPTLVDVVFEALAADRTRVTLTHSGWEVWAEKVADMRNSYNGGWVVVFETRYAGACAV